MVLYPREGHGLAESIHTVDRLTRSMEWYDKQFTKLYGARVHKPLDPRIRAGLRFPIQGAVSTGIDCRKFKP